MIALAAFWLAWAATTLALKAWERWELRRLRRALVERAVLLVLEQRRQRAENQAAIRTLLVSVKLTREVAE